MNQDSQPTQNSKTCRISSKINNINDLDPETTLFLPIESFRETAGQSNQKWARVFKSSGTTSEQSASSGYSLAGMALYQARALRQFKIFLEGIGLENNFKILSLIPPIQKWPDSSLAQMVHWISEIYPLEYITEDQTLQISPSGKTLLFGTAFHFVNRLDFDSKMTLGKNVHILETGGTKGKSREITKDEFYKTLSLDWGIPSRNIHSEYGMSELACQAYYTPPLEQKEWFRFSEDVKLSVQTGVNQFKDSGLGNLTIFDPGRLDYPQPIRTHDVCELKKDGRFRLIGRAETAPLKGCSLNAESLPSTSEEEINEVETAPTSTDINLVEKFDSSLNNSLQSQTFLESLTKEFQSKEIAESAIKDLLGDLPPTRAEWCSAIAKSSTEALADQWLLIPPSTHSIAIIYPMSLLLAAGKKVRLRLPSTKGASQSIVSLVEELRKEGFPVSLEASLLRIDQNHNTSEKIFVFGQTSTLRTLKKTHADIVSGFGDLNSIVHFDSFKQWDKVFKDLFSLRRLGCCSARLVVTPKEIDHSSILSFAANHKSKWSMNVSPQEHCGSLIDADRLGAHFEVGQSDSFTLATTTVDKFEWDRDINQSKFLVTHLTYNNRQELEIWLSNLKRSSHAEYIRVSSAHFTGNTQDGYIEFCSIGDLNKIKWDGTLCHQKLFH